MPRFDVTAPNGQVFRVDAPEGATQEQAIAYVATEVYPRFLEENKPKPERGIGQLFTQGFGRGMAQTGVLLGDYLPAMLGRGVEAAGEATGLESVQGAGKSFAERQLREAAASELDIAKRYPREFASYEQVTGPVSAARYAAETLGEGLPSIIPGLVTGGAGAIAARGLATAGARAAATFGATAAGSASQTIPEAYASLLRETGKEEIGTALVAGGINAALESIMPASVLAKMSGPTKDALVGSIKRRLGLGFVEGAVMEGLTEGAQEAVNKAAVSFVDENKEFFTSENWKQILDSSIRGAIVGGTVSGATNVAFGRREQPPAPTQEELAAPSGAEPTPTETTPTEVTPTEVTPTGTTPTETTPTETTPTETTPTETTPTETTPTETTPTGITPTETTPTETTPTGITPTGITPTETTPTETTPTETTPTAAEPAPPVVPEIGKRYALESSAPLYAPLVFAGGKTFTPKFSSDIEKALYHVWSSKEIGKILGKNDAAKLFLREIGFTDKDVTTYGGRLDAYLSELAGAAPAGGKEKISTLPSNFLATKYAEGLDNVVLRELTSPVEAPTPLIAAPPGATPKPSRVDISPRSEVEINKELPGLLDTARTLIQGLYPGAHFSISTNPIPGSYGTMTTYLSPGVKRGNRPQFMLQLDVNRIKGVTQDPASYQSYLLKTFFHELSHPLEFTWIASADNKTFEAIIRQYVRQRNPSSVERFFLLEAVRNPDGLSDPKFTDATLQAAGLTREQYEAFRKSETKKIPEAAGFDVKSSPVGDDYQRSFAEWIAEQGAQWFAKEMRGLVPQTTYQKFQKTVLDHLRSLYERIASALGITPSEGAFEQLLKDVYGRRSKTPFQKETDTSRPGGKKIIVSESAASQAATKTLLKNVGLEPTFSSSVADPETSYQTGQPVSVDAYHGSPFWFDRFDPARRGQNTRARSAREGYFFSRGTETANAYAKQAGSPVMLEIGIDNLARSEFGMATPRQQNDGYTDLDIRQSLDRIATTRQAMSQKESAEFDQMMRAYAQSKDALGRDQFDSRTEFRAAQDRVAEQATAIEGFLNTLDPQGSRPNVRLSSLSFSNPLVFDMEGKNYSDRVHSALVEQAKREGRDGIIIQNTVDGGPVDTVYVAFNDNQIRDRYSPDPAFATSSASKADDTITTAKGPNAPLVKSWKDATDLISRGDQSMTGMVGRFMRYLTGANPGESYGRAFARNVVNSNIPFLERADLRNLGKLIEGSMNATGRVMGLMTTGPMGYSRTEKRFFYHSGVDAQSLLDIFKEIGTANADQTQIVAIAMRELALRRDRQSSKGAPSVLPPKVVGLSDQELQNIVDSADPKTKAALEKFQRFNDRMLEMSIQAGVIPRELGEKFKTMMYTPFYRLQKQDLQGDPNMTLSQGVLDAMRGPSGIDAFTNRVGQLAVGGAIYGNLYENILNNYSAITSAAVRNVAYQETARVLTKINRDGGDTTIGEVFDAKPANMESVRFRDNGVDKYLVIHDPAMFQAISALSPQQKNAFVRAMGKFTDLLRKGVTASPPFQLRNLIRGLVELKVKTGMPVFEILRGTMAGFSDTWNKGDAYREIVGQTGFGGFGFGSDPADQAAYMNRVYQSRELSWNQWQKYPNAFGRLFDKLEGLGELTEMGPRIAYYNYLVNLKPNGMSKQDAAWEAVNLVNYHRHGTGNGLLGSTVSTLIPLTPFLTARIQGLYRLVETGTAGAPKSLIGNGYVGIPAAIVSRGLMVLAINAAVNMMYGDDDWYKKLSVKDRMSNMYVKVGDTVIALPRAYEIGELFGGLPTLVMDSIRKENGSDVARGLGEFLYKTFVIEPVPQAFKPILELYSNKNMFTGLPIENLSDKRSPTEERFDEYTSSFAKMAGQLTKRVDLSPKQVDTLIRGYFGTMSTLFLGTVDSIIGTAGVKPQGVFGDPTSLTGIAGNLTGLSSILKTESQLNNKFVGDFYELKEKITQVVTSMKDAADRRDTDMIKARLQEMPQASGLYTAFNSANARLTEINRQMDSVRVRPDLTPDQKTQILERLRDVKGKLAQQMVGIAEKAGVTR